MRAGRLLRRLDAHRAPLLLLAQLLLALLLAAAGESQILAPPDPVWQRIEESGRWRVGLDPSFPPFEMLNEQGEPIGYDVDLARAIASEWDVDLELIAIGYDGLLDALIVGRIDSVVSALPYDRRMSRDILYSNPYFEGGVRLAVTGQSQIDGVEALEGLKVGVEWGSVGDGVARRLLRQGSSFERIAFETVDGVVTSLANGDVAAALVDGVSLRLAQGNGLDLKAVGPVLEGDAYVIAMPISALRLADRVDEALEKLGKEGVLVEIEERWFGSPR